MSGAILREALRRNWRAMLFWGLGIGLVTWMQVIIITDVTMLQDMQQMMETLPSWMLSAFGVDDVAYMATPEGYVAVQFFSYALLMFSVYALTLGLSVISADEDRGALDMVLSAPLPRWRLMVEKIAVYSVLVMGVVLISYLWLWLGVVMTPALTVDMNKMFVATLNTIPASLMVLAVTVLITAFVKRRGTAIVLASVFVAASYLFQMIGSAAEGALASVLSGISYFNYADSMGVLQTGWSWGNSLLLLGIGLVAVALGLWRFQQRDIGG